MRGGLSRVGPRRTEGDGDGRGSIARPGCVSRRGDGARAPVMIPVPATGRSALILCDERGRGDSQTTSVTPPQGRLWRWGQSACRAVRTNQRNSRTTLLGLRPWGFYGGRRAGQTWWGGRSRRCSSDQQRSQSSHGPWSPRRWCTPGCPQRGQRDSVTVSAPRSWPPGGRAHRGRGAPVRPTPLRAAPAPTAWLRSWSAGARSRGPRSGIRRA